MHLMQVQFTPFTPSHCLFYTYFATLSPPAGELERPSTPSQLGALGNKFSIPLPLWHIANSYFPCEKWALRVSWATKFFYAWCITSQKNSLLGNEKCIEPTPHVGERLSTPSQRSIGRIGQRIPDTTPIVAHCQ